MAAWFLILRPLAAPLEGLAPVLRLAADVLVGGGVYAAALYLFWRAEGAPDGAERRALALGGAFIGRLFAK